MSTYSYSITGDTANGTLSPEKLVDEINGSSIDNVLLSVEHDGDDLDIIFDAALDAGEQTILDGLVAAHDGIPYPAQPQTVKLDSAPQNPDGRFILHETPRRYGTITYFTGAGDDTANEYSVGGSSGQTMAWHHEIGDGTQTIYVDFNCIENESYLHAGILQWKGALNDDVTCEVVPKITTYTTGTGKDFTLYGGYLIVPTAPGSGDVDVTAANRVLVEVPLNETGQRAGAGYFDADWNTSTKQWENFAPNYTGTGRFNMFAAEVVLDRFANRLTVLGDGMSPLGTHDASQFGHNNRGKLTIKTNGTDHEWWGNCWLIFHRKKTS
jgi:hypothetical protein